MNRKIRVQRLSSWFIAMEILIQNLRCTYPSKKILVDENCDLSTNSTKIFSDVTVKRIWLREELEPNTHQNATEGRVLYVYYLLLTCGLGFLTKLFSKNVVFGARVCPPLGAGEIFFWKPRGGFFTRFEDFWFIFLTLIVSKCFFGKW